MRKHHQATANSMENPARSYQKPEKSIMLSCKYKMFGIQSMRHKYLAASLMALLSICALPSRAEAPILLTFKADIGDIHTDRMHLEIGIHDVYAANGLRPGISISLTEILTCSIPNYPCRASKSVSNTYDQVDDLIEGKRPPTSP